MRTLAALLVLVALAAPIDAEHCTTYSTTRADLAVGGYYYATDGGFPVGCVFVGGAEERTALCSAWVYEESNGIEGLQRGDEVVDDTCHGMIERDTIIF